MQRKGKTGGRGVKAPMLKMTVDSMFCRALVPRSMILVTSPVLRMRWNFRSRSSVCANRSRLMRLQGSNGGCAAIWTSHAVQCK